MKLMIGTPAYSGKVHIPFMLSFTRTAIFLASKGIEVEPFIVASGSLLVAERNRIVQAFWDSDCTHLLCIDSDLGWPAEAVFAMLETGKDFVAGCYPARGLKDTFIFRATHGENKQLVQDEKHKHLIKMEYIPAGFMLLSREAIKKMRDKYPELYYEPKIKENNPQAGYCFFNTEIWEGEFWGEDYVFCRNARNAGIDIWVDPLIQFDHDGTIGMLAETITDKPPVQQQTISEAA